MPSTLKFDQWQTTAGVTRQTILQVVTTVKTDTFTSSTNSFIDVTGMSATLTPLSTSSRILVMVSLGRVGLGDSGGAPHSASFRINRNGTSIFLGDGASNRPRATFNTSTGYNADHSHGYTFQAVDSPATTSAVTYQLQMFVQAPSSQVGYINRGKVDEDSNNAYTSRTISTITLMEIAA